jgi:response regulator NasT
VRHLAVQLEAVAGLQVTGVVAHRQPHLAGHHQRLHGKGVGVRVQHDAGRPFARQHLVEAFAAGLGLEGVEVGQQVHAAHATAPAQPLRPPGARRRPARRAGHGSCACQRVTPVDKPPSTDAPALRVLLIDDGAHRVSLIRDELTRQGHLVVGVVDQALLIHDCVLRLAPDVVIVDAESPSRDTLENLAAMSGSSPRPVVVFAEDPSHGPMQQALQAGVSAYVIAGLHPQRLMPVLQVAIARFEQDRALREQLGQAQTQLSERKLIERAKGVLMDEVGLSEEQAYKHLRKLAMDRGQRLGQVAERIVRSRHLLNPQA